MEALRPFAPRIVGTLPLGIAVADSDIDIVCHAPDPAAFADAAWAGCRLHDGFGLHQWTSGTRPVVARFLWAGWPFEVFGEAIPVDRQNGFLHFEVQRKLLELDDGRLRAAVMRQRALGLKTEPAFAAVLGMMGDPYESLLDLASESDARLRARLDRL